MNLDTEPVSRSSECRRETDGGMQSPSNRETDQCPDSEDEEASSANAQEPPAPQLNAPIEKPEENGTGCLGLPDGGVQSPSNEETNQCANSQDEEASSANAQEPPAPQLNAPIEKPEENGTGCLGLPDGGVQSPSNEETNQCANSQDEEASSANAQEPPAPQLNAPIEKPEENGTGCLGIPSSQAAMIDVDALSMH